MDDYRQYLRHPRQLYHSYGDAAKAGQLVFVKCKYCRKGSYFLASDLIKFIHPKLPIYAPPFPCSTCGVKEFIVTGFIVTKLPYVA